MSIAIVSDSACDLPKDILKKNSLGAAHHRTLHLIERNEGISVNELLIKLKITKPDIFNDCSVSYEISNYP